MFNKKVSFSTFGFTLIELLIAIAIVGIIAVVAFVALDPARRFAEARNSTRWTDVTGIVDAIKLYTVDSKGSPPWTTGTVTNGNIYMIGTCTPAANCVLKVCTNAPVTAGTVGVSLSLLTSGTPAYLAALPISQSLPGDAIQWSAASTGYFLIQQANGGTRIGACQSEASVTDISVTK